MSRKKKTEETDDLAGTVEGKARDFFEREKAAYEERTGEKVLFEPPTPLTRTPLKEAKATDQEGPAEPAAESETPSAEGEA